MGEKIKIIDSILLAEDVQKEVKRRLAGGMGETQLNTFTLKI